MVNGKPPAPRARLFFMRTTMANRPTRASGAALYPGNRCFAVPLEAGGKILPAPKADETINPEWRLYARSSGDDKAGVMAILCAFDALITSGVKPTANLKFFFEGEEEAGSPHLGEILKQNKQLLQSDAWIICDGPVHQSGRK